MRNNHPTVIPSLKIAFKQGDWHNELCDELLAAAWSNPTSQNLALALDAMHCIQGVTPSVIEQMDEVISGRLLTHWPLFYRLCSFDIAQQQTERLIARMNQADIAINRIFNYWALSRFPRILDHLAQSKTIPMGLQAHSLSAKKLLQNTRTVPSILEQLANTKTGSTVALVGNGPSVQGSKAGQHIDAQDVVIRFNNTGVHEMYDHDLGRKTSLWVLSPNMSINSQEAATMNYAVTGPDPWTRPSRYWRTFAQLNTATFDIDRWHALVLELSAPPSAGILMLDALRQAGINPNSMTVHGFDRLSKTVFDASSKNHYRDRQQTSSRHNWPAETELFHRLMKS